MTSRERVMGACPLHELRTECWDGCLPERVAMAVVGRALSTYWWDRKRGMGVKRLALSESRVWGLPDGAAA